MDKQTTATAPMSHAAVSPPAPSPPRPWQQPPACHGPGRGGRNDVRIKTPDGVCDAAYFHPATGKHPGVMIWTDIFGLRPTSATWASGWPREGYAVLVPNPFYRTAKAPVMEDASKFDFNDPADRAKTAAWTGPIKQPGAIERDASGLYRLPGRAKGSGTRPRRSAPRAIAWAVRWCSRPRRRCPIASARARTFHGGGLVTDKPDSPHLLIPKMKAQMYLGHRRQRRHATARRQGQAEGSVRRRQCAGRSRGLCRHHPWLVRAATCRCRTASRSTTSPKPSAPGAIC